MAISVDVKYLEFIVDILEEKRVLGREEKEHVIKQCKRLIQIENQKIRRRCARIKIDI